MFTCICTGKYKNGHGKKNPSKHVSFGREAENNSTTKECRR